MKAGDIGRVNRLMDDQLATVTRSLLVDEFRNGSQEPVLANDVSAQAHPEVAFRSLATQIARREMKLGSVLEQNGWNEIETYGQSIVERYKQRNKSPLLMPRPGMTNEEMAEASLQFEPVRVDPNEIATYRQRLVKLNQQMQELGTTVWNDPRTARIARVLNAEAEFGKPGYLQSEEQSITQQMPLHERALLPIRYGLEAALEVPVQLGVGAASMLQDLGAMSLDGLTLGNGAAHYTGPTSWVQDRDGRWYHNGGKVGAPEMIAGVWHLLTGQFIDQEMADYADVAATARMRMAGIEDVGVGVGQFLGSMVPFMAGGGQVMAGGAMMTRGLGWLATGGKTAASLTRAQHIVRKLSAFPGAAAGLGAYEAVANGSIEGYGSAFMHGAIMAPPMMLLGAMGRGTERLLRRTEKIPKRLAKSLAGAAEGMGFAGLDPRTWELAWQFVKDPEGPALNELATIMIVNMAGMAALKTAGGLSPGEMALEGAQREFAAVQRQRSESRKLAAKKAVTAEQVATVSEAGGVSPETLKQYGDVLRAQEVTAGKQPEEAKRLQAKAKELEEKLDLEEAELDRTRADQERQRFELDQALKEAREMEPGPEKRARLAELMQQARPEDVKAAEAFGAALGGKKVGPPKVKAEGPLGEIVQRELERRHQAVERRVQQQPIGFPERRTGIERRQVEQVPGKEPGIIGALTPEAKAAKEAADRKRFLEEGPDPLESPKFGDLPREMREQLLRAKDRRERLEIMLGEREEAEVEVEALRAPTAPRPGEPASLRMVPQLEQQGVPGTPMIRQKDILLDMQGFEGDPIRVPVRAGVGMRGARSTKGILGWFNLYEHVVRLSGERDIVVASHEWSHAMDTKLGKASMGVPKALLPEFFKAAEGYYPGFDKLPTRSRHAEAWAEFWARHMLDDPLLAQETGAFHAWAMQWLASPGKAAVRAQMQRIQAGLRQYRDQGAVQRVRASWVAFDDAKSVQDLKAEGIMTDTAPAKAKGFLNKVTGILNKMFLDDMAGLKATQRKWVEIAHGKDKAEQILADTPILSNPTRLHDALRMTASKQAERFLIEGTHDLAGRKTGESLGAIFRDVGEANYDNFITYLVAKRSLEVLNKGLRSGLGREDIQTTITALETPAFRLGAKRIKEWSNRLINYAEEGGLFSADQAEKIRESYETYIPFQRVLEGPKQFAPGRGVAERGSGVKRLSGAEYEIKDPVNALGDMARSVITKTHQNMVMKAMLKFSMEGAGRGGFLTEVKRTDVPENHPLRQIMRALEAATQTPTGQQTIGQMNRMLEQLERAGEIGASVTLFTQQIVPKGSRPIIAFTPHFTDAEIDALPKGARAAMRRRNHKLSWFEVDNEAFDALMGIDMPQTILDRMPSFIQHAVETPAKILRAGATVLSPAFTARNYVRDVVTDFVYSKERNKAWIFSAIGRSISGAMEIARGGQAAELFENLGGKGSTFFSGEVAAGRTARELIGRAHNPIAGLRKVYGWLVDKLSVPEEMLRVRAFGEARDRALSEGHGELEANLRGLEAGKEITVNFTRGGTLSRAINRMIPYWTAGIQGNRRFFRSMLGHDGKIAQRNAMVRGMVGITIPTLALWWLNMDEEWYQELPEWRRLNYWNIKLPGMDSVVSIPKPFEIGKLFANIPEMVMDEAMAHDPIGVQETMWDLMRSLLPQQFLPAVMSPVFEQWANKDLFTGREIVPSWMEMSRLPRDQVTAYTRWYGKMLADAFGFVGIEMSPIRMEQFVDSTTGGLVGRGEDLFTSIATLGGATTEAGFSAANIPFAGTFMRQQEFQQSRSVQRIFDLDKEFTQRAGSKDLTPREENQRVAVGRAKEQISRLKKKAKEGKISRQQADELSYRAAAKALKKVNP